MTTALAPVLEGILVALGGLTFVCIVMSLVVLGARAVAHRLNDKDDR